MMNRILFACLFLALSTESSSLSCRWMDHKFRQHNEETLNLLDTMVSVLIGLCLIFFFFQAEDKLAFSVQILEEVAALFEEDHSAASWEDSTVRNFLNIVNKQAEELHSCVSKAEMVWTRDTAYTGQRMFKMELRGKREDHGGRLVCQKRMLKIGLDR
uniref:Interferon a3-like n=1 Tax=Pundamilia nyererei TaxID=303518 RepID=A0A3B4EZN7_9CICH